MYPSTEVSPATPQTADRLAAVTAGNAVRNETLSLLVQPLQLPDQPVLTPAFRPRRIVNPDEDLVDLNSGESLDTAQITKGQQFTSREDSRKAGQYGSAYRSRKGFLATLGVLFLLGSAYATWGLVSDSRSNFPELTENTVAPAAQIVLPSEDQVLTVNSNLKVMQNTTLVGDLEVQGTTTLQGVVVKADSTFNGSITVQGNGNFSGNITASNFSGSNLTVTGNSNFAGTIVASNVISTGNLTVGGTLFANNVQGEFSGSFSGNASALTNISATNCVECVRLQSTNPAFQIGNVAINGNVDIVGLVTGRKLQIRSDVDDSSLFSIQNAAGISILAVDSSLKKIKVSDLSPNNKITIQSGTIQRSIITNLIQPSGNNYSNDDSKWSGVAVDGFQRIVYGSSTGLWMITCQNTECSQNSQTVITGTDSLDVANPWLSFSQNGLPVIVFNTYDQLYYVRCINLNCSSSTLQSLALGDLYDNSIAVAGNGNVFISYMDGNDGIHVIYCIDALCSNPTNTLLNGTDGSSDKPSIAVGKDNLPRITYVADGYAEQRFLRCINTACTSSISTLIDSSTNSTPFYYGSLTLNENNLARFTYEREDSGQLYLASCNDIDCTSNLKTLISDHPTDNCCNQSSISLLADGSLAISHEQDSGTEYIFCPSESCLNPNKIRLSSNSDYDNSISTNPDGHPVVVFYSYDNNSFNVVTLTRSDGTDLIVLPVSTAGTNIGVSDDRFGQVFAQNINLQTASSTSGIFINQIGVKGLGQLGNIDVGSGPLATFQINGTTKAEFDANGSLILHAIPNQIVDLQQFISKDGLSRLGVNSDSRLYTRDIDLNSLTLGVDGSNLLAVRNSQSVISLAVSKEGSIQLGSKELQRTQTYSLDSPVSYTVFPADFDNDGDIDLMSSTCNSTLRISYNQGNDVFSQTNYSNSGCTMTPVITDFNGDGYLDFATAGSTTLAKIRLNLGNGTFGPELTFPNGLDGSNSVYSIGSGDVTGDGITDLIQNNYEDTKLSVIPGVGDGTFLNPIVYSYGTPDYYCSFSAPVAADFNNDGSMDVASSDCIATYVSLNNGDGTLAAQLTYGGIGYALAQADINYDGNIDLIGDNGYLLGNGVGSFSRIQYPNFSSSFTVSLVDQDNDGRIDIARGNTSGPSYTVNYNTTESPFTTSKSFEAPYQAGGIYGIAFAKLGTSNYSNAILAAVTSGKIFIVKEQSAPKIQISSTDITTNLAVLVGSAGQTGDYLQVQDANRNILTRIDNKGAIDASILKSNELNVNSINSKSGRYGANAKWYNCGGYAQTPISTLTCPVAATATYDTLRLRDVGPDRQTGPNASPDLPDGAQTYDNSVRFNAWVRAEFTGIHTFYINADDCASIRVNNTALANTCSAQGPVVTQGTISLVAGTWYPVEVDYHQGGGSANYSIEWSYGSVSRSLIPINKLYTSDPALNPIKPISVNSDITISGLLGANSANLASLTLQGAVGQSNDLLNIKDSTGNTVTRVGSDGILNASTIKANQLEALSLNGASESSAAIVAGGLQSNWYNSDAANYKTVGSGTLAFSGIDGPINWTNIPTTRPAGVNANNINTRWTGWVRADFTGTYTYYTTSDDGSRIYINGQLVVNNWFDQGATERSGTYEMTAGVWVPIVIEYYQGNGGASVSASWSHASLPKGLIPATNLGSKSTKLDLRATTINSYGSVSMFNLDPALVAAKVRGSASQTADLQQWQNSVGTVLSRIDAAGNLSVRALTVNGHIITGNSSGTTTIAAGANAGTGATCTVSGNDTAGTITLNSGTTPSAGTLCTMTFATSFGATPRVVLTPNNSLSSTLQYFKSATTTNMTLQSGNAPAASSTYQYDYHIQQ